MQIPIDYRYKSVQSFSHMLGCISALIIDYIKKPFSNNDDFFKTVRVTTEVPFQERANWKKDLIKKPRPMLIVDPKFDISDEPSFMSPKEFDLNIPNDTYDNIWIAPERGIPLVHDINGKYDLYHTVSRYKMTFNLTFVFDSEVQQMQVQDYIRQNIRHNSFMVISRYLEHNIPQNFMEAIALIENMDINSPEFMSKINTISQYPITHRVRPGSGNKEFFCMTPCKLHMKFNSFPSPNGNERKGKVITSSSFSDTLEIEFNANSMYYLRSSVNVETKVNMTQSNILTQSTIKPVSHTIALAEVPIFNEYEENRRKELELAVQFTDENDILELLPYINGELRRIILYHLKNGLPISKFIKIKCAEESTRLPDERLTIDFDNLTIAVKKADMYKSYVVVIYSDHLYTNELIQSITAFDDYPAVIDKTWNGGNVIENIHIDSIQLNTSTLSLTAGTVGQLTATILPKYATNKLTTWSSSNTSVASVNSSGLVTAISPGTATVNASADGKNAICNVIVTQSDDTLQTNSLLFEDITDNEPVIVDTSSSQS